MVTMVTIKMMVNLLLCQLYKHRPDCCSLQPGPLITRSVGCLGVRDYNDCDDNDHDCDDCDNYIDGDCDFVEVVLTKSICLSIQLNGLA